MIGTRRSQVWTAVRTTTAYSAGLSEKNSPVSPTAKERRRPVRHQPLELGRVADGVQVAPGIEVGDQEREQACPDTDLELRRRQR